MLRSLARGEGVETIGILLVSAAYYNPLRRRSCPHPAPRFCSAGGTSVCHLLASPLAKGLFKRAIVESGPCNGPWGVNDDANDMYRSAEAFRLATNTTLEELRAMDVDELMEDRGGKMYGFIAYDGYLFSEGKLTPERIDDGELNVEKGDGIVVGSNTVDTLLMTPWDLIGDVR